MLRIDLTHAETEPVVFEEQVSLPGDYCVDDVVSAGPVKVAGKVERAETGFDASGEIEGTVSLRCSRCLAEFPFAFREPFQIRLQPVASAPREDETRLGRDEMNVLFFERPELNLVEMAAEQLHLTLPMKPLCDEACRGLCASCGANLNEGPCQCPPARDERWAPLANWRPEN